MWRTRGKLEKSAAGGAGSLGGRGGEKQSRDRDKASRRTAHPHGTILYTIETML